jgi:hypothetical protein
MPAWKPNPQWLRAAVESGLGQRDCNLELIVVDDGSPEPVADLLASVDDQRLRIIRIEHAGHAAARNAGFAASQGEWIRHLDCDDILDLDSTRHQLSIAAGQNVVAYGGTMVCDQDLQPRFLIATTLQGDVVEDCLLGRFETRGPALLFPRSVLEAAGPWDSAFRVSGDWDLVLRAVEHARVAGDQRVALYYRRHGQSLSMTANVAAGEEARSRLIRKYLERHPEQRGGALERRAWRATYVDRGEAYWGRGERREALTRFGKAVRADVVGGTAAVATFFLSKVRDRLARTR